MNQAGPSTGIMSRNPPRIASTTLVVAQRQGQETNEQRLAHVQVHLDTWWNSFTDRSLKWVYMKKAGGQIMGSAEEMANAVYKCYVEVIRSTNKKRSQAVCKWDSLNGFVDTSELGFIGSHT
jgi:hypothetical protein